MVSRSRVRNPLPAVNTSDLRAVIQHQHVCGIHLQLLDNVFENDLQAHS